MAKRKSIKPVERAPEPPESKPDPPAEPPKGAARYKNKTPLNLMVRNDIREALDRYIDSTYPQVAIVSAVEAALIDFLNARGFPVPKIQPRADD